ncbi:MAG: hypothetical protein SVY41_01385 [Candidatus Nanohaloarchaea archaeon]|nr:hypothetical protein [Candidatus Nanohaloarchaea archaeon]
MDIELEECRAGGWKARFDPDRFDEYADRIRQETEPDADTEHMLVWHVDGVKCSFVRSSGVLLVRAEDREEAERIVNDAVNQ